MEPVSGAGRTEVAIVGGGIAGLVVALRLTQADVTCHVLESADRFGGRLLTHSSPAGRFDLGATWFWPGEARVAALVEELGISTHPQYLAGDALYQVDSGVRRLDGNPIDVVSGRFTNTASSLTDRLAERLGDRISLTSAVQAIDLHRDGLTLTHAHGTIAAEHAVLALPPPVSVHTITFRPPLPDRLHRLAAATPVWMGNVAKVVVVYDEPFWRRDGLAGAVISHVGPLQEIHDMSGVDGNPAALFGFAPLAPEQTLPTEHDIIGQLAQIFGPVAATPVEVIIKDWRLARDALPEPDRQLSAMDTYGDRRYQVPTGDGRIHWASTETAPENPGHIEGAIAAAERAVAAILATRPSDV